MPTTVVDIIPNGEEGVDVRSFGEILPYIDAYAGVAGDAVHFRVHGGGSATVEPTSLAWSAPGTVIIEFLDGITEVHVPLGPELLACSHIRHRLTLCGPLIVIDGIRIAFGGEVVIVADESLTPGGAAVGAIVKRYAGFSGSLTFESTSRPGAPSSITAQLINLVQGDGHIIVRPNATHANASVTLHTKHLSAGGSDNRIRVERTNGAGVASVNCVWDDCILVGTDLEGMTYGTHSGTGNHHITSVNNYYPEFDIETLLGPGNSQVVYPDGYDFLGGSGYVVTVESTTE